MREMKEDELHTPDLSHDMLSSLVEAVRQNQAAFSELARLAAPRISGVQSALAALSVPPERMGSLMDAIDKASVLSSYSLIPKLLAEQQADIQRALRAVRLPPFPELPHIGLPPGMDLDRIARLSQQASESLRSIDSGALAEALRHHFEPTLEQVAEAELQPEDSTAKFVDFLWTWTLVALHEAGLALDSLNPNTVFTIVFTLVLHFHMLESSSADLEALGDRIEAVHRAEPDKPHTVERFAATVRLNLRTEPSDSAHVTVTMSPNQTVELIRQEGDWCYVRYYDHIAELPRHGWASRIYLKPAVS